MPITVKAQLHEESIHNPNKGHPWSTQFKITEILCHWAPQDTIMPKLGDIADLPNKTNKNRNKLINKLRADFFSFIFFPAEMHTSE